MIFSALLIKSTVSAAGKWCALPGCGRRRVPQRAAGHRLLGQSLMGLGPAGGLRAAGLGAAHGVLRGAAVDWGRCAGR
jgi:hypothetical protein